MKARAQLVGETGSLTGTLVQVNRSRILVGRDATECDLVLTNKFISKSHALIETDESGTTTVRDLGSRFGTFVNGNPVVERTLSDGDRLGFGPDGIVTFRYSSEAPSADAETVIREVAPAVSRSFAAESVINIGRAPDNDIVLNVAAVSRHHARLTVDAASRPRLVDVGSTNGTYVNGKLLREPRVLEPEDVIFLGGFLFTVDGRTIRQIDLGASRICAFGLSKTIGSDVVMRDISLALLPGEFVGIMGPSGCGKSTLMDALDGLQPAPAGTVYLGELELYRNFNAVRRSIGHVPQRDILHDDLTVEHTLLYAARLRLPETTDSPDIRRAAEEAAEAVSLRHKLGTQFRHLSGGEQKRLSIAIELITKPTFLFLDEPTSPLDPETTEDLMDRFRKLADLGQIVVMITHKFEKFRSMDQVAILAKGGRLAFFGPPAAALEYFACNEPAEIFRRLSQRTPDELAQAFADSPQHHNFVRKRLLESRGVLQYATSRNTAPAAPAKVSLQANILQWLTLTQRFFEIKLKDRRNTALLLVQSPVIALILVAISGGVLDDAKTLFIAAVIAVWFGANNAMREIVAEFPIFKRERRFSLQIAPYVMSKFTVLGTIGLIQSLVFVAILTASHLLAWKDFPLVWAMLYLTTLGGVSMALFFSATVNTAEKALSILPLLLIPQLLLSGFLKPVDPIYVNLATGKPVSSSDYDAMQTRSTTVSAGQGSTKTLDATQAGSATLSAGPHVEKRDGLGVARYLSALVLARWTLDGLVHVVSMDDTATREKLASQVSVAAYGAVLDGEASSVVEDAYHFRIWLDLGAIVIFSIVSLPVTMWALKRRDVL